MKYNRFKWPSNGKALNENVYTLGKTRFTVLTDRLIRIEYDNNEKFTDNASQFAFYRNFPVTEFSAERDNGLLTIETEYLVLKYKENSEFTADTLSIELKKTPATVWNFGKNAEQLKGTASTLDNINGAIDLDDGVLSKNGYTVVDDSKTALLSDDGWFEVRKTDGFDIYFFGYGHDYYGCLADFYRLTGEPPLLPDYAFGNWWSRYYRYTQEEYLGLMDRFIEEKLPFSVSVVDMDWHTTETPKESQIDHPRFWNGWTGYSWNKELFPDYKEFLSSLNGKGLKTALNLHPSNGIGFQEDMYKEMAMALGVDPESKKLIKLDLLNPDFMEKYFDIIHHPYEQDGVDFWWMDWQQGTDYWWVHDEDHPESELEIITPLWIINHLHILDIARDGKRPMFFSRYSGLGSHRYPVGFSGDTITTWESLDFQPYFTANASNAGYCWWSHDIGGHMQGFRDDELQIRWLQLGVLSPINRYHSTNDTFAGKEPWNLNDTCRPVAEDWLRFRHKLFPYLYTMNYRTNKELKPLVSPMYYEYPENEGAYKFRNQYFFGSEFFVAPITSKNDTCSTLGSTECWLPEGKWFDFFCGFVYEGDKTIKIHRTIKECPVFAKAGAIIPMQTEAEDNKLGKKEKMTVYVFPEANNTFNLYEDEGDGNAYKDGDFVTTEFNLDWNDKAVFTINPAKGNADLIPENRTWDIKLRGFAKDINLKVYVDGKEISFDKVFDAKTSTTSILVKNISVNSEIKVEVDGENLTTDNSHAKERMFDIIMHSQVNYATKSALWKAFCGKEPFLYMACPEKEYTELRTVAEELRDLMV